MRIHAEANLSALIESTDELIWSVDPRYRLITFNRAFREYFERNFGGPVVPGIGLLELLPPARAVLWPRLYDRALRGEKFRTELPLSDGRTMDMAFSPIRVDGQISGVSVFGKDITERIRVEGALREAEEKYRAIFDGALEGMYRTSVEGKNLLANAALARMLGYSSPEEVMATIQDSASQVWVDPEERARYLRLLDESGTILGFECQYKRKDGSTIWVSLNTRRVCGADGRTLYLEGFIEDITERRRTAQALQENESRFRTFFEENRSVMFLAEPLTGQIVAANQAACEFYGYPRDQFIGMFTHQINLGAPGELSADRQQALRKERNYFRYAHQLASGEVRDIELYSSPIDVNGRPLLYAIVIDITERRRAEMQLRNSEERYRATFEQAAVGILHTSFEGHFLRCNERFSEIIGYPLEEVTDLSFQQITPPQCLAQSLTVLERISNGEISTAAWEKQYIRKDGSLIWVKMTVSIQSDGEGRPIHCLALVEDINARKVFEAQLAAASALLKENEERYRAVFQTSPDAVIITLASDGTVLDINQKFVEFAGYEREELLGHPTMDKGIWVNAEDRERLMQSLCLNGECRNVEFLFRRKNGELFWGRLSASVLEIGGTPCILTFARDITEERASKERLAASTDALQASEKRYKTIFQTNPDAVVIARVSDGAYLDCNQGFLDAMGYQREEVIGRSSLELGIWVNPLDRQSMVNILLQHSHFSGLEMQFRRKNGEVLWASLSASEIEIDGIPSMITISRDISSAKEAEIAIRNLAYYDPLTGLPNRRLLLESVRQMLANARNSRSRALLFVDLDDFKTLNDTHGHPVGDLLLQQAARRISACQRGPAEVYRLGGDEFVVILEDLSEITEQATAQAAAVGENIVASLSRPYLMDNRECLLGACIGIAFFGDQDRAADEILQQANIALHQAKTTGRNTICFFSPALQAAVNARAALEENLRQAIKTEQFLLYYQPQIERGRVTGVEALIRWSHPERGIVPPNDFIPLAEETRMILPLGDWVLEAACRQIAAWAGQRESSHLAVAVNISALQFRQPEFVQQVLGVLRRTGANPNNLKLELTESVLVENIEEVIAKVTELKSHGLSFSLDDFGTGYSSLAYLKRLPLDELKIDRAFVHDMLVDAASGAIAQTIIALGRAMGLSVVAEGVENEEQRGFLAALGCHAFQGYLFSRPLALENFEAFLRNFAKSPD